MRRKNIVAGLIFLAFGVFYAYQTSQLTERTLPNTPGPSFLPWILTAGFMALSLSLLIQGLRMKEEEGAGSPVLNAQAIWGLIFFGVYLSLLPYFGFLISTPPFFLGLMWLMGERRPLFLAGFSVAMPIFVYGVFQLGFQILLPAYAL